MCSTMVLRRQGCATASTAWHSTLNRPSDMRTFVCLAAIVALACAAPAAAQTYASGGIGAAVTRSASIEGRLYSFGAGNNEVLSWMLRAGTSINSVFGVELEFARDSEFDVNGPFPLPAGALNVVAIAAPAVPGSQVAIFP